MTGSSCGTAPSSGCGGTLKVDAGAETKVEVEVKEVKCRACSLPARCPSACESCDGSCGEGQRREEGRSWAIGGEGQGLCVSASRQGCMQQVRTHIVQKFPEQGESLGISHCV